MIFIKTSAIVFLILVFCGEALAANPLSKCDNPGVLQTEYWKKFENMVKNEYYKNYVGHDDDIRLAAKDRAKFLGHALGRLSKAVHNNPERQNIFSCVQLGVYQTMGFVAHFHLPLGITESVSLFDMIKEASIGGLDAQVAQASGVTSVEPYEEYLNAIVPLQMPISGTSTTLPVVGSGTIIKADPADKFGGNSSSPASSSGTCDNWMTITMDVDMEKSCQGFVDNGYGRRPSTTDCIVCNPDDWHPATKNPQKSENGDGKSNAKQTMQLGINYPGYDFKSFLQDEAQPGLCRAACEENERCQAWTYVKPGTQRNKAKCWLKYRVPEPKKDVCCVSGVTDSSLQDTANARLIEQACSTTDLKSGKEWRFQQNVGYSYYYEHSDYLCPEGGESAMKIEGKKLIRFSCQKSWQSCTREKALDGDLIYPAEDYQWGKRWFNKLKVKWRGMIPRDLYIEKK